MRILALCVLVALPATALAATSPVIELQELASARTMEKVNLELVADTGFTRARLSFDVTASDKAVDMRLVLPARSHVIGMAVTHGEQQRSIARAMFNNEAERRYRNLLEGSGQAALVHMQDRHTYFVRVGRGGAHMEVELRLPSAKRMWLKSSRGLLRREVKAATPVASSTMITALEDAETAVDDMTALFADEPGRGLNVAGSTISVAGLEGPITDQPEEDRLFRRILRDAFPRIRACVAAHARVDVGFAVMPSGRVSAISIVGNGGTSDSNDCISETLLRLRFRPREDSVMVNVPVVGTR